MLTYQTSVTHTTGLEYVITAVTDIGQESSDVYVLQLDGNGSGPSLVFTEIY